MSDAAVLVEFVRGILASAGLIFLRIGAAAFLLPTFGELIVPARVPPGRRARVDGSGFAPRHLVFSRGPTVHDVVSAH